MHLKGRWSGCLWQVKGVKGGAPFVMFGDGTEAGKVGWNWCWYGDWVYLSFFLEPYYLLWLYGEDSIFISQLYGSIYRFFFFLISLLSTGSISLFWPVIGSVFFQYIKNDRLFVTDFQSAASARWDASRSAKRIWHPSWQIASGILSDAEEIWGGLIVSDTLW